MTIVQTGEDYEKYFNPDRYLGYLYSPGCKYGGMIKFLTSAMHHAFADGNVRGGDLLDVGSGPTIHTVVSASNYVDNIYLTDYANKNIDVLKSWWKGTRPLQENMMQQICDLENKGQSVADRVSQLRKQVCGVFNLDILSVASLDQTGAPRQYDIITSGFCLEAVATTKETYLECAKNVRSLLKPGGFFVHIGELNNDSSEMDDLSFTGINLNSEDVKEIYIKAGFCIESYIEEDFKYEDDESFTCFVMRAKKID